MLSLDQLSAKTEALLRDQVSLDEFEDWFSVASWDIQRQDDRNLRDAVFAIEAVFSRYLDGNVSRAQLPREVSAAIRPFETRIVVVGRPHVRSGTAIASFAEVKSSDDNIPCWIAGNFLSGAMSATVIQAPAELRP